MEARQRDGKRSSPVRTLLTSLAKGFAIGVPVCATCEFGSNRGATGTHTLYTMQSSMRSATAASTSRPTAQRVPVAPSRAACSLNRRQQSSWREGLVVPQQQRPQVVTSASFFDERVSSGLVIAQGSPVISPR